MSRPPAGQNFNGAHARWGAPRETYEYRDQEGTLFYVCHYDTADDDSAARVITWTWGSGNKDWNALAPNKPRPLYRLDQIQARPTAPILIVSDERIADAVQRVMRETIVSTWHGGLNHLGIADWVSLAQRVVNIWPDADEPNWEAASKIAGRLLALEATVGVVDTHGCSHGWNLAAAIQEGWTLNDILRFAREHKRPITRPIPETLRIPTPIAEPPPQSEPLILEDEEPEPVGAIESYVDIGPEPPPAEERDTPASLHAKWREYGLALDGNGKPHINVDNVIRVISADTNTWSHVWYDEFLQKVMSRVDGDEKSREWTDVDTLRLMLWFQRALGFVKVGAETILNAITVYAHSRRRNEAREWLQELQWDGAERLPELLTRGFGAPDMPYIRAVGRCFIVGMAARILRPGCKLDNLPVFEGAEGIFKSSALEVIGGPYYTTTHERVGEKDFYLVFAGKMLIEISEMESFSRVEVNRVKGVVSTATDRYRPPYARAAADHPRMCVFAGTTNTDDWNESDTGARRMWPVACGRIDLPWLRQNREQLFAEAVARLERGELWYDVPAAAARREQRLRLKYEAFDDSLAQFLSYGRETTVPECLEALGITDKEKWNPRMQSRVAGSLKRAGYIQTRVQRNRTQIRVWRLRLEPQEESADEPDEPSMPPPPDPPEW